MVRDEFGKKSGCSRKRPGAPRDSVSPFEIDAPKDPIHVPDVVLRIEYVLDLVVGQHRGNGIGVLPPPLNILARAPYQFSLLHTSRPTSATSGRATTRVFV